MIWTDYKNLAYLRGTKWLSSRQARWALFLGMLDLTHLPARVQEREAGCIVMPVLGQSSPSGPRAKPLTHLHRWSGHLVGGGAHAGGTALSSLPWRSTADHSVHLGSRTLGGPAKGPLLPVSVPPQTHGSYNCG